jgi:hypothetical protein
VFFIHVGPPTLVDKVGVAVNETVNNNPDAEREQNAKDPYRKPFHVSSENYFNSISQMLPLVSAYS